MNSSNRRYRCSSETGNARPRFCARIVRTSLGSACRQQRRHKQCSQTDRLAGRCRCRRSSSAFARSMRSELLRVANVSSTAATTLALGTTPACSTAIRSRVPLGFSLACSSTTRTSSRCPKHIRPALLFHHRLLKPRGERFHRAPRVIRSHPRFSLEINPALT